MSDLQEEISKLEGLEGDESGAAAGAAEGAATVPWVDILKDTETFDDITLFLQAEIEDVRDGAERSEMKEKWQTYRRLRRSTPEQKERNWPWRKSSNVEPPVIEQKVNTVTSKLNAAFAMKKPPVQAEALADTDFLTAQALERYLGWLADNPSGMSLQAKRRLIHYDQTSLGLCPVYVAFVDETRSFKKLGAAGEEDSYQSRYIGPTLMPVRLEDFLTRPYWTDLQRAPWFAVEYRYFYHEIVQRQQQNYFHNVQNIIDKSLEAYDEGLKKELEDKGISVGDLAKDLETRQYQIYLVHVYWDIDKDGVPEDLILWFHPETRTVLRADYNSVGKRTITLFPYMEEPDHIYARGLCEMLEGMQKEISALHRMRLDGTELAMLKIWLTRRGSGINPDEELNPFKVLAVDDVTNDVKLLEFTDPSDSCLQGEAVARDYADKVSGASDIMSGFYDPIAKSGQNASSTLALLQAGNSILNAILETNEIAWADVWQNVIYQLVANKERLDFSMMPPDDQTLLAAFFNSLKVEDLPTKFKFKVRVTDINQTGDSRRQMVLAANQLYYVYAEKAMALFGMIQQVRAAIAQASMPAMAASPAGGTAGAPGAAATGAATSPGTVQALQLQLNIMLKFYVGYTQMLQEVFTTFNIENPTRFLPNLDAEEAEIGSGGGTREDQGNGESSRALASGVEPEPFGAGGAGSAPIGAGGTVPPAGGGAGMAL